MTNLPQLTIIATCGDNHASFDFIIGFDGGEDDLLIAAHEALLGENPDHDTTAEFTLDVQDWDTTPEQFRSINSSDTDNVYKWGEYVEDAGSYGDNPDVILAALECGIDPDQIEEAYQGSYNNDEDFAQEIAERLGAVEKNGERTDGKWIHNFKGLERRDSLPKYTLSNLLNLVNDEFGCKFTSIEVDNYTLSPDFVCNSPK